ncbi:Rpn family recombination-promoting nuclease/putative transposase [Nostoc sp. CMAA1605]|uniref:Rpn family recombination-promoting nuclease/putative transposase n=1 Tax=Nostoc sp. CMAA1605 TaxID=2055159 RepID=UPI001F2BEE34|nr:Rpn family recombination-promoting nuclease/putative transposase [Nostoc sp. CMAA1605]MCF4966446.1 flagellar assembly protein H [Nostoc sp. CMAA1605]
MIDHDRLFKELIQTFFWEFIELFLPEVLDYVNKDSLTFLPEEIFTDVTSGDKRKIDLLAKVKFREQDTYFLIHLENQAYNQKEFERRMFHYFARLDAKYLLPIFPIVIFSYDEPKRPEKSQYTVDFPNKKILEFNYIAIQLNNLNWRNFLNQPNPVAAALMAKMDFKPEERVRVKLECLRMLVTLQLNPAKMELISGFIDTYLRLNATEEQALDTELKQANLVEEEGIMEIVTSWMEKGIERGIERGIEQGIERGIEQGEQKIVKRQLKRRFNNIDSTLENRIDSLSVEQIENLADAIFDFQSVEDLINWLDQQN